MVYIKYSKYFKRFRIFYRLSIYDYFRKLSDQMLLIFIGARSMLNCYYVKRRPLCGVSVQCSTVL